MDSSASHSRRRDLDGGDELEEGEYVPGRDESSDTDGSGGGYRLQPRREGDDEELHGGRMRRLEDVIMASGRRLAPPRSPTPSSCESDGTISDDDDDNGNPSAADSSAVVSAAGAPARFACHVCGRWFGSPKAVEGHMRVHGNARHMAAVGAGWAATGKRGWTGGKPYSVADDAALNSESTDNSTDIVAVRPLEPVPMAIAMPSTPVTSTRTNLSGEESSSASAEPMQSELATVVTGHNSSTVAVVSNQSAPPAHSAEQARPVHQQAHLVQQPLALAPARLGQPPREYSCKLCGKTYATHQGLGGHAAGHRNRQKEAEAAAAAAAEMMMMGPGQDGGAFLAALRRGGRRAAEEPHECSKCHKVFATGVALGGHMRMHYTGPPIVHKKSKRMRCLAPPPPPVSEADLRLALSTLTEERPSPAPAVAVAGRVRLFGIDIGPQVQAPPAPPDEEGSSGTAEGSSSERERQQ
ncbi:unnamed protein product [Urochloa decumbens]|uniref:C2H2-type domain-containing protein n=1 Tax=Urochloa decumbens TaxID=240449 RepID=A0ABC8ZIU5_9POAL